MDRAVLDLVSLEIQLLKFKFTYLRIINKFQGAQEEFWNCADIAITDNNNPLPPDPVVPISVVTSKPLPKPEPLTDPGFIQITTPIYMSKVPINSLAADGQIACALHGVEPNLSILYKKIKVCLDNCKKDITQSCPSECFCVWTIEPKE